MSAFFVTLKSWTLIICALLCATPCFALPQVAEVANGSAEFNQIDPLTLNINASDQAIINYNSFNIAANETVNFLLPSTSAEVLNRVIGSQASSILGRLFCNGTLFLINPNGITFGASALVDVGSLVASTRDITNSDFISGNYIFEKLESIDKDRLLLNQGQITIREGGFGVLIAGAVENQGTIIAPLGTIAMAGGDLVRLDIAGNGLISLAIDRATAETVYDINGNPITDQLKNTGTLEANGGVVLLKAESVPGLFEKVINLEGYVRAKTVDTHEGKVVLAAVGGPVSVTGVVEAGKSIEISAPQIEAIVWAPEVTFTKTQGDIFFQMADYTSATTITLEGEGINITYLKDAKVTLESPNGITALPGVIISASQLNLSGRYFGSSDIPLTLQAAKITLQRTQGSFELLESTGLGTSILLRGPPSGFGSIIYNSDTDLTLNAETVSAIGSDPLYLYGNITFYNFSCLVPDKQITFQSGKTYTFRGSLNIVGSPDLGAQEYYIKLRSSTPGSQYFLNFQTTSTLLERVNISDAYSLNYLSIPIGIDAGNNYNLLIDPIWDGGGADNLWSNGINWDGNAVPTGSQPVTFNSTSTKNCTIDNVGTWTGGTLTITSGYTGTITQNVNITVSDFSQAGGTYSQATGTTLTVSGNWSVTGGTFTANTGSTVTFTSTSAGKTILSGSQSFYNITFNGVGGEWTIQDTLTVLNDLTIITGTLNVASGYSVGGITTIDTSTSANATLTSASRKTFWDSVNNHWWAFYYTGTAIEYAYSPDGSTWTTVSTLAYNTANYALTFKNISETGYVFLVTEANSYDIYLLRGALNASTITFDAAQTVYDGAAATAYYRPAINLDNSNYIWVAAQKYCPATALYEINVIRSATIATGDLSSWQAISTLGSPHSAINDTVLLPLAGSGVLLISADNANNIVAWKYDGAAWAEANTGGDYSWLSLGFSNYGINGYIRAIAVYGTDLYIGGNFTTASNTSGAVTVNYITRYSTLDNTFYRLGGGSYGVSAEVWALAVNGTDLYIAGDFISAYNTSGALAVNRITRYSIGDSTFHQLGGGTYGLSGGPWASYACALAVNGTDVYIGGAFTTAYNSSGSVTVNYITRYSTLDNTFYRLGGGSYGVSGDAVRAIVVSGTDLYIAGTFASAYNASGAVTVNYITRYSTLDNTFYRLGGGSYGVNGHIYALAISETNLYIGGGFTTASNTSGAVTVNYITRYSTLDNTFYRLGGGTYGLSREPYDIIINGTDIYIAGNFTGANNAGGSITVNYITRYSTLDNTFYRLGGSNYGVNAAVIDMAMLGNDLFIGGSFTNAYNASGTVTARYLAQYTPVTGSLKSTGREFSAVTDPSGNPHVIYRDFNDDLIYRYYNGSSWASKVTVRTGTISSPALTIDPANNDLYAYWVESNNICYKKGVTPYALANWDAAATTVYSTGTNTNILLPASLNEDHQYLVSWTNGSGSPYSVLSSLQGQYNAFDINAGGNWTNLGSFNASSATVTFTGNGSHTITSGSSSFFTLITDGCGTYTQTDDLTAANLTIDGGTWNTGSSNLTVSSFLSNNGTIVTSGDGSNLAITPNSLGSVHFTNNAWFLPSKTYNTLTLDDGGTVEGDITTASLVNNGIFDIDWNNLTVTSSLSGSGTIVTSGDGYNLSLAPDYIGNIHFTGSWADLPAKEYGTLTIDGETYIWDNITIRNLIINGGPFDYQGYIVTITGDLTLNNGASLSTDSGSSVVFSPGGTHTWADNTVSGLDLGIVLLQGGNASPVLNISGTAKCTSFFIDTGHTAVMLANSSLNITGSGTPLTGTGILDVASHTPNTIQYTGSSTTSITLAGPVSAYYNLILGPMSNDAHDSLGLLSGEEDLSSAVIDTVNGYAYFGTNTAPGMILKIRLSDFTKVGTLALASGINYLRSAVIDTTNSFAYFGTYTDPGIVVKINLRTFTAAESLMLDDGENKLVSAVIDTNAGYAYFGTYTSPGIVVKIDLAGFIRAGSLVLNAGENMLTSAVIDMAAGYAYFGTYTSPGIIAKIGLSDFSEAASLTLEAGENMLTSAVIDTTAGFAYFGTRTVPGKVVKVDLLGFTRAAGLTLNLSENYLVSAVIDTANGFAYFGDATWNGGRIIKIKLSDFTRADGLTLYTDSGEFTSAVIDTANGYAYFGTNTDPGIIVKVNLASFTETSRIIGSSPEGSLETAVIDTVNGYAYFGTYSSPGIIIKIRLSDFTRVGALTLDASEECVRSAVIDTENGFAYFGTDTYPGIVVKVDLSTFTKTASLTLNEGEDSLLSAVIDTSAGFAYFGTYTWPGIIVKIDLSTFTEAASLTLDAGEESLVSAVIDTSAGFAYFGTNTNPGRIIKINLSSFTKTAALALDPGESFLSAGVIDMNGGYAYFGTGTSPGIIVKINLSTFTKDASLYLEPWVEDDIVSAAIDTVNGYIYFGTNSWPGRVIKVSLASFTKTASYAMNDGENCLRSAVIDTVNGYVYFGTDDSPATIVRIALTGTAVLGTEEGQTLTVLGDLTVDGCNVDAVTFNPLIKIAGDLTGRVFDTSNSTVEFFGSGVSTIYGSRTFNNLTCTTAGKQLNFEGGMTQTILGTLTLKGSQEAALGLASTDASQWNINPLGTIVTEYISATNSANVGAMIYSPFSYFTNCVGWMKQLASSEIEQATQVTNLPPMISGAVSALFITPAYAEPAAQEAEFVNIDSQETGETQEETTAANTAAEETTGQAQPAADTESSAKAVEPTENEEQTSGFDWSQIENETSGNKYAKRYTTGKYKTMVVVYEGKVVASQYDERGLCGSTDSILPGQEIVHTAEVGSTRSLFSEPVDEYIKGLGTTSPWSKKTAGELLLEQMDFNLIYEEAARKFRKPLDSAKYNQALIQMDTKPADEQHNDFSQLDNNHVLLNQR